MKRGGELKRKTPLRSASQLAPGKGFARPAPMARGTSRMRNSKPASEKPKRAARNAGPNYLAMCRCQRCYLTIAGICNHDSATVVACHSNQAQHGKGMGMKALDVFTVPGCACCHREIDQGGQFTKAEKFAIWDAAYQQWEVDRKKLFPEATHFHEQRM